MVQRGLDRLIDAGEVRVAPESFDGRRRSSAVGAILATLPSIEVSKRPTYIRLANATPLHDQLARACRLATEKRTESKVVADDPLAHLMSVDLRHTLREVVNDDRGYKTQGSAGQRNLTWAETPWVAIMDRLVTESPQRGNYLVYLVHREGKGVFLSLNQGITDVRQSRGAGYQDHLHLRARRLEAHLTQAETDGLIRGRIDLAGQGQRTRAYENANVVSAFYSADDIPHDVVLVSDLRRFMGLYAQVTSGVDSLDAGQSIDTPLDARVGLVT